MIVIARPAGVCICVCVKPY